MASSAFALGIQDAREYSMRLAAAYQQIMQVSAMQQQEAVKQQYAMHNRLFENQDAIDKGQIELQGKSVTGQYGLARENIQQTGDDRRMFFQQQGENSRALLKMQEDLQKVVFEQQMQNSRSKGNNEATITAATIAAQGHSQASLNAGSASIISSMLAQQFTPQQAMAMGMAYQNNYAPAMLGLVGSLGASPKSQLEAQKYLVEQARENRLEARDSFQQKLDWATLQERQHQNQMTSLASISAQYDKSMKMVSELENGMFGPLAVGPDGKKVANSAVEAQIASRLISMSHMVANNQMSQSDFFQQSQQLLAQSQFGMQRWQPYLQAVAMRDHLGSMATGTYGNAISALPPDFVVQQVHDKMSHSEQQSLLGWMGSKASEFLWNGLPLHDYFNHAFSWGGKGGVEQSLDYGNAFSNAIFQKTGQAPSDNQWSEFMGMAPTKRVEILRGMLNDPDVRNKAMLQNIVQTYDVNSPTPDRILAGFNANTQLGEKGWLGTDKMDFGLLGDTALLLGGGAVNKFIGLGAQKVLTAAGMNWAAKGLEGGLINNVVNVANAKKLIVGIPSAVMNAPIINGIVATADKYANNMILHGYASSVAEAFPATADKILLNSPFAVKAAQNIIQGTEEDARGALAGMLSESPHFTGEIGNVTSNPAAVGAASIDAATNEQFKNLQQNPLLPQGSQPSSPSPTPQVKIPDARDQLQGLQQNPLFPGSQQPLSQLAPSSIASMKSSLQPEMPQISPESINSIADTMRQALQPQAPQDAVASGLQAGAAQPAPQIPSGQIPSGQMIQNPDGTVSPYVPGINVPPVQQSIVAPDAQAKLAAIQQQNSQWNPSYPSLVSSNAPANEVPAIVTPPPPTWPRVQSKPINYEPPTSLGQQVSEQHPQIWGSFNRINIPKVAPQESPEILQIRNALNSGTIDEKTAKLMLDNNMMKPEAYKTIISSGGKITTGMKEAWLKKLDAISVQTSPTNRFPTPVPSPIQIPSEPFPTLSSPSPQAPQTAPPYSLFPDYDQLLGPSQVVDAFKRRSLNLSLSDLFDQK